MGRRSKMSIKNKLPSYRNNIIRPTISYVSVAWSYEPSKTQLHRLEVLQTKILRQAFRAPRFVRYNQILREANIPKLKQFLHKIALRKKAEELYSLGPRSRRLRVRRGSLKRTQTTPQSSAWRENRRMDPSAAPTDGPPPTTPPPKGR